jgi:hypothetical protein
MCRSERLILGGMSVYYESQECGPLLFVKLPALVELAVYLERGPSFAEGLVLNSEADQRAPYL